MAELVDLDQRAAARDACAAAEAALHAYVESLPARPGKAEREQFQERLAAYRAAVREYLGPVEPAPCTVAKKFVGPENPRPGSGPRPRQCSYRWGDTHVCALGKGHSGGVRTGCIDHACGCGAIGNPIEASNGTRVEPTRGPVVPVIPCPKCREVRHEVGPEGSPQRRCWNVDCRYVWLPAVAEAA